MSFDRGRLTEAIEVVARDMEFVNQGLTGHGIEPDWRSPLVLKAARLVASEDTLTIWWCEPHKSSGIYRLGNRCCWNGQFTKVLDVKDCRMVERALLAESIS